jgi:hypothetical protein
MLRSQERRHGNSHSGTFWRYAALSDFTPFQNCANRCKSVQAVSEKRGLSGFDMKRLFSTDFSFKAGSSVSA